MYECVSYRSVGVLVLYFAVENRILLDKSVWFDSMQLINTQDFSITYP